ncbi:PREDICTED: dormancy-associated protein 1-like [Camelina sativa]|nr:PREDICTED: dormancy-associated protein 1-like [Camelina sativa]
MHRSLTMPAAVSPGTPTTPTTPTTPRKDNVWRSVFNPGSNLATRAIGSNIFDKPTHPNSPSVYDWLYSGESRSQHR